MASQLALSIFYYRFLVFFFLVVVAKSGQEDLVRFGLPSLENVTKSGDFSYILVEFYGY
jgi:hypothetical protein